MQILSDLQIVHRCSTNPFLTVLDQVSSFRVNPSVPNERLTSPPNQIVKIATPSADSVSTPTPTASSTAASILARNSAASRVAFGDTLGTAMVNIYVRSSKKHYHVHKEILSKVDFFKKMFTNGFRGTTDQAATLPEVNVIVSIFSLDGSIEDHSTRPSMLTRVPMILSSCMDGQSRSA